MMKKVGGEVSSHIKGGNVMLDSNPSRKSRIYQQVTCGSLYLTHWNCLHFWV